MCLPATRTAWRSGVFATQLWSNATNISSDLPPSVISIQRNSQSLEASRPIDQSLLNIFPEILAPLIKWILQQGYISFIAKSISQLTLTSMNSTLRRQTLKVLRWKYLSRSKKISDSIPWVLLRRRNFQGTSPLIVRKRRNISSLNIREARKWKIVTKIAKDMLTASHLPSWRIDEQSVWAQRLSSWPNSSLTILERPSDHGSNEAK